MIRTSGKLTLAALTYTSPSFGAGRGAGTSRYSRSSGGPNCVHTSAFTETPVVRLILVVAAGPRPGSREIGRTFRHERGDAFPPFAAAGALDDALPLAGQLRFERGLIRHVEQLLGPPK